MTPLIIKIARKDKEFRNSLIMKLAREFVTKEKLQKYLQEHPNANPKNHSVKKWRKITNLETRVHGIVDYGKPRISKNLRGLKPGSSDDKYHEAARYFKVLKSTLEDAKTKASAKQKEEWKSRFKEAEKAIKDIEKQINSLPKNVKAKLDTFLQKPNLRYRAPKKKTSQ